VEAHRVPISSAGDRISADLGHLTGTTRRSVVLEGRDGFF
jgi:hypothetical protein